MKSGKSFAMKAACLDTCGTRRLVMLLNIIQWLFGIALFAYIAYVVLWNLRMLYYGIRFKCAMRNSPMIQCRSTDCRFSGCCERHVDVLTEEETQLIHDWIAKLKKECG